MNHDAHSRPLEATESDERCGIDHADAERPSESHSWLAQVIDGLAAEWRALGVHRPPEFWADHVHDHCRGGDE